MNTAKECIVVWQGASCVSSYFCCPCNTTPASAQQNWLYLLSTYGAPAVIPANQKCFFWTFCKTLLLFRLVASITVQWIFLSGLIINNRFSLSWLPAVTDYRYVLLCTHTHFHTYIVLQLHTTRTNWEGAWQPQRGETRRGRKKVP